jgi:hypothetical protein
MPLKKALCQELLHIHDFILASLGVPPGLFKRAPSIAVWFVDVAHSMPNPTQLNYQNFDNMAIPLKESLHREPVHIYNLILASPRVPPGLFQRAPSVPGFLFVYDSWGSTHSMPQATTKTFPQRLFRSRNP